eukprot:3948162-Pyramimonas_sp.AAC.1
MGFSPLRRAHSCLPFQTASWMEGGSFSKWGFRVNAASARLKYRAVPKDASFVLQKRGSRLSAACVG